MKPSNPDQLSLIPGRCTNLHALVLRHNDQGSRQPNGRKTGANSFLYVELPRPTYISSWDIVKDFILPASQKQLCPARILSLSKRHDKRNLLSNGKWEFAAGLRIQRTCSFRKANEQRLFLNGSWEMLPGQGTPASEGWPARFLYERWELGNGKWAMGHRPVTMDHRKV